MPTVVSSTLSAAQATSLIGAVVGADVQVLEFEIVHRGAGVPSPKFANPRGHPLMELEMEGTLREFRWSRVLDLQFLGGLVAAG